MSDQVNLTVERRTVMGKQVKHLRREGKMPANLYGQNQESIPLTVDTHELETVFKHHGPSTLYRLRIRPDGTEQAALVRHVQREPVTGAIEHVDFLHVSMTETIRARIPIRLVGEAPAVTLDKGVLLHPTDTIEVEALPSDLPQFVDVDISGMTELNSSLYVRDLTFPSGVTPLTTADDAVVSIAAPRTAVPETTVPEELTETPTEEIEMAEGETTEHAKEAGEGDTAEAEEHKAGE